MATAGNATSNGIPFFKKDASLAFFAILQLALVILPLGVVSNILNIIVFVKTGAKDNVTVSLLALSVSDLAFLVVISPQTFAFFAYSFLQQQHGISIPWLIDPNILRVLFYWYAHLFYETSTLITVYISVVRCACVALPFSVKRIFTATRAIIAFVAFFIGILLLRIPLFMAKRALVVFDPASNSTRLKYVQLDDGGLSDTITTAVSRNAIPWAAILTLVISVTVMIAKLHTSAKFRSAASTTDSSTAKPSGSKGQKSSLNDSIETAETKQPGQILSSRETQAVKSVVLVAAIFLMCQTNFVLSTLGILLVPDFKSPTSKTFDFYLFLSTMNSIFGYVNASVNICVYYNFNSRYRQCMRKLLRLRL